MRGKLAADLVNQSTGPNESGMSNAVLPKNFGVWTRPYFLPNLIKCPGISSSRPRALSYFGERRANRVLDSIYRGYPPLRAKGASFRRILFAKVECRNLPQTLQKSITNS
jgi:hypothetical protein